MVGTIKQAELVAQKTLQQSIVCKGVGLHSGRQVSVKLRPGEANSGIIFIRTDLPGGQGVIPARWHNVVDTRLCTVIGNRSGASVGTIEHLMAAFSGCGIDNAVVEVDGVEAPILDGSSAPWVSLIKRAGMVRQAAKRRAIRVHRPVVVREDDKVAILSPSLTPRITVEIDFPSAAVGFQQRSLELVKGVFNSAVAGARTFGFMHEVEYLRNQGLALGGSLENAIVIDGDTILNREGLRFQDEFVRHKILDCVGDLYLAGGPILGHFHGYKPGHKLNNELLYALFAQPNAWSYVAFSRVHAESTAWTEERLAASA